MTCWRPGLCLRCWRPAGEGGQGPGVDSIARGRLGHSHTDGAAHQAPLSTALPRQECVFSHSVVSDSLRPHGLYSPWNSPGQNTGVGSLSLLQGIFLTQELNQDLLHYRQILCHGATWEALPRTFSLPSCLQPTRTPRGRWLRACWACFTDGAPDSETATLAQSPPAIKWVSPLFPNPGTSFLYLHTHALVRGHLTDFIRMPQG